MTRTDSGLPIVREVGVVGGEADAWRAIADASNPLLREREPDSPSALETFAPKAKAAEDAATLKRLQEKRDNGGALDRSERAFLEHHEG